MAYYVTIGKKDDEDRKKKLQAAQNTFIKQSYNKATSPSKGVSSGTPSSLPRAIDNLPKVNASQKAESYGPKQWNKNSNITTLPKAVQPLPRPVNNRLTSALERASKASDLTPTKAQRYRSDNFLKGVGMSFAATVPTLVGVTKQSLSDWHNKIKEEGLQSSLSEMGRNMDNPDWTYGNPVSTESIGYKRYQKANEYFEKAQEGLTPSQQKAMGLAASIAQNAVTLPTAFINPSAPLVIMGANSAANKANELTSQGKTATEALGRGLLSGAIEAATEKLPLDDLLTIAKTGGKSVVKNVLKQMGTEGAEELASYIMNYAADVSSNDKNAKFSAREALDSFLGGAVSGGITGGVATAFGKSSAEYLKNYNDELVKKSEQSEYMKQIYDVMMGKIGDIDTIKLGRTPGILQKYGAKDMQMTMKPSSVRKIAYPTNYLGLKQGHNLGFYALEQLPNQLSNPIAIAKSKIPNSFIIFTEFLDSENLPVIAAIHLDKKGNIGISNEVASVYGKREFNNLVDYLRNSNMILYEDKNRGLDSLPADGLQLSAVEATSDPIFSIYQNADNINIKNKKISDRTNANVADSMTRSTDYINSPPGDHVQDVNSITNNIIPQTSENINNSAPKELGERQTMPSVKTLNPAQIAKISEDDMNTTPPINRVNQQYKGNAESRFKKSMQSQTVYSDEFKKRAAENVNINTYDSMSNKEAFSMAQARLDENGAMEANRWRNMNPQEATTVDRAEGMILAKRYEQAGDYEGMIAVVEQLRKMATAAGQSTQIFAALQRMTPEGMAYYAQKSLDNAREEMVKGKTQKWINENESRFHLTPEETAFIHENMAKIGKASSQREKDILLAEIQSMISEKLPSTTGEKMRTLARISMLFNAKTQIRNVLGNVVVMPRALLSDAIGSGIDKAVSGKTGMRTTGTFKASSLKGVPHGISEAFYDYRHGINTRNVQNDRFDLGTTGAFKGKNILSKGVKKIDDLTSFMLDAGDRGFYEMWYENSLANQMALNNVSEPTQAMEDLAAVEAAQRTWQDDNGYTSFVSDVKRGLNRLNFKGYGLGDIVMPFVKTPANLVKAVVDYSPVGVVKALMKDSRNLNLAINTGKGVAAAQRAYVNDLSKGITGTLLLIFYGFLADKGIIKGDASEDKDVRNFERNILGMLPYSVKIGDKTYSYEWAQPVGGTAAVAANAVEGYKTSRQQGGTGLASVTNALYSGVRAMGTTLFNLSFLEGLKNFFNSGDPIKGITESVGAELSKFLPTALGQVAQTMDEYNRTTYVYGNPLRTNINKALLKIPGARETLPAAVDVLGREVKGHNSVADAFINPVNYGEENTLPTADEIYSLYKETGNKSVIPPTAPYTVTYKGNTVTLSPEQTAQYQTVTGTIINKSIENLTKNSDYQHMKADEKVEVLNDIYAYAQEKAKDGVISIYELSNTSKEADEAAEHGLSEADYFFYKYYLNRKDEDKKKMSNEQKRDKLKNNKYLTVREKELLDDLLIDDGIYMPKEKNVDYGNHESFKITQMSDSAQEKWTIFKNAGMSADEYSKVYPIAAGNGKKADKIAKLQSMGYSYNDAVWIYKQATKKKK